jgi:hypothetical protein
MTLGVVMLVHSGFARAEQMVRIWAAAGCPVVVHVDARVPQDSYDNFVQALGDLPDVGFSPRHACEWGMWGLVAASQAAARQLLDHYPDLRHVFLASGSCLPLRPVAELRAYLDARPDTDFIESVTTADVGWTVGGLDRERFTLRFPFSWKKQRVLFDAFVTAQRALKWRRRIPAGLVPHLGSQWWCLTRATLTRILDDPRRAEFDRYFKKVWIPDECYYQTLARYHGAQIESRSLTLAKFDYLGKPHIFFDDHSELLARSGCFVARKIWPKAEGLFASFPRAPDPELADQEPGTGVIDKIFAQAVERRATGRQGLYAQSRFPFMDRENAMTAAPYTVLQGFDPLIPGFADWLGAQTGRVVHGHLFAPDKVHFAGDVAVYRGGLSDKARLRDYNVRMFLTNLSWNARDQQQAFLFGPADNQQIRWMLSRDAQASVWVISGGWAVSLFLSGKPASAVRAEAARLQQIETRLLQVLRTPEARSRRRIMTLAEFLDRPVEVLQAILDDMAGHRAKTLRKPPPMVALDGFAAFLQDLKNQGMQPHLTGDFPVHAPHEPKQVTPRKRYYTGTR